MAVVTVIGPEGVFDRTIRDAINLNFNNVNRGKLEFVAKPATATSPGTAGQIAYENGYFYVCVAASTWQRAALATF